MATFMLFAAAALFFPWHIYGEDACRVVEFLEPETGKYLKEHVIHSSSVDDDKQCRLQCYLEGACLSYNLGTQGPGNKLRCELSGSDHHQHPEDLVSKIGFWYHPTASLCGGLSCPPAASCLPNKQGKLRCVCPAHWSNMGNCEPDNDEYSSAALHDCSPDAFCNNTVGSYTCTCKKGFTGDGRTCQIINECTTGSHNCHVNATCTATQGSYKCTCNADAIGNGTLCLGFPFHWKLNGSDPFISLHKGASYQTVGGRKVLYLNGSSYAETPAIPIQTISFSILCWVKVLSTDKHRTVYSDWSDPHQFKIDIYNGWFYTTLRRNDTENRLLVSVWGGKIPIKEWMHVAFTWNRNNRIGKAYMNGTNKREKSADSSKSVDLNPTGHTVFDIGYKRDGKNTFHGYLRDLMVINRAISDEEVADIFSRSK